VTASDRDSLLSAAWRPGGVIYLVLCLAGLAAGLWPDAIYPSHVDVRPAPLPVLQTLALAQVAFVLLVLPLLAAGEHQRSGGRDYVVRMGLASAVYLWVAAPCYVAAFFLADATETDITRAILCVASLMPLAWAAGAWLAGRAGRPVALLGLLLVAMGLPAGYYIAIEFLAPVGSAEWVWRLAPATFTWDNAASRGASALPKPLWAFCVWPIAAAVVGLLRVMGSSGGNR